MSQLKDNTPVVVTDEKVRAVAEAMWMHSEEPGTWDEASEDWLALARVALSTALTTDEVCVQGDWFKVSELPKVLGRVMEAQREAQREAKRFYLRAEKAEKERDEALTRVDHATDGWQAAEDRLAQAEIRLHELESMTAREHLDAARDARETGSPLPKGATIPAGVPFWAKADGESSWEFVPGGSVIDFDTAQFPAAQYILLDPPTPARPDGAEEWDEELGEMPAAIDLTPEQRTRLADALAERDHALGVRAPEDGGER